MGFLIYRLRAAIPDGLSEVPEALSVSLPKLPGVELVLPTLLEKVVSTDHERIGVVLLHVGALARAGNPTHHDNLSHCALLDCGLTLHDVFDCVKLSIEIHHHVRDIYVSGDLYGLDIRVLSGSKTIADFLKLKMPI